MLRENGASLIEILMATSLLGIGIAGTVAGISFSLKKANSALSILRNNLSNNQQANYNCHQIISLSGQSLIECIETNNSQNKLIFLQ